MVNPPECEAFDNQSDAQVWCQPFIDGAHPAQVAHSLFAAVGDKPDIGGKLLRAEHVFNR